MTMLRTNLATRPFYNERLVHWLIAAAAVLVIAFTAFNVGEYLRLSGRQGGLEADAARDRSIIASLCGRVRPARRARPAARSARPPRSGPSPRSGTAPPR